MTGFSTVCLIYCAAAEQHGAVSYDRTGNPDGTNYADIITGPGGGASNKVLFTTRQTAAAEQVVGYAEAPANHHGLLDGAIVPAKSGRAAHTPDGEEVDRDGMIIQKEPSFLGRLMSAIHLSDAGIQPARPTPIQPEYLKSERLYVKQTEPSFFENLIDKLNFAASDDSQEAPQAYMDGVSKPNWSLDRSN